MSAISRSPWHACQGRCESPDIPWETHPRATGAGDALPWRFPAGSRCRATTGCARLPPMDLLRTPDDRFVDLPDFDLEPHYAQLPDGEGGTLRMAYVEAGPADGPV